MIRRKAWTVYFANTQCKKNWRSKWGVWTH